MKTVLDIVVGAAVALYSACVVVLPVVATMAAFKYLLN